MFPIVTDDHDVPQFTWQQMLEIYEAGYHYGRREERERRLLRCVTLGRPCSDPRDCPRRN